MPQPSTYIKAKVRYGFFCEDWVDIATSEVCIVIKNWRTHFAEEIQIEYNMGSTQFIRIEVYKAKSNQLAGATEFKLSELVEKSAMRVNVEQTSPRYSDHAPEFLIRTEPIPDCQDEIKLQFSGQFLMKYCFDPKSYISLWRSMEVKQLDEFQKVYQTSSLVSGHSPVWEPISIRVAHLCNNDYNRPIQLFVHKKHPMEDEGYVGPATFTLNELLNTPGKSFEIFKKERGYIMSPSVQKREKKNQLKSHMKITFGGQDVIKNPSFTDYIKGGCEIATVAAIDFTKSNIEYTSNKSLHYIQAKQPSNYEKVLYIASWILLKYDTERKMPLFGFGARINGTNETSHCFPVSLQNDDIKATGIENACSLYKQVLPNITFSGPKLLAPVLKMAIDTIKREVEEDTVWKFYIIVIMTNGGVADLQQVTDCIVQASHELLLTIIFVGVGEGPWDVQKLDAQNEPLVDSKGRKMSRNIVQFVPNLTWKEDQDLLERRMLSAIPKQLVHYFKSRNIWPGDSKDRFAPPTIYSDAARAHISEENAKETPVHPFEEAKATYSHPFENANVSSQPLEQVEPTHSQPLESAKETHPHPLEQVKIIPSHPFHNKSESGNLQFASKTQQNHPGMGGDTDFDAMGRDKQPHQTPNKETAKPERRSSTEKPQAKSSF